jgi:hypothetical protein
MTYLELLDALKSMDSVTLKKDVMIWDITANEYIPCIQSIAVVSGDERLEKDNYPMLVVVR